MLCEKIESMLIIYTMSWKLQIHMVKRLTLSQRLYLKNDSSINKAYWWIDEEQTLQMVSILGYLHEELIFE